MQNNADMFNDIAQQPANSGQGLVIPSLKGFAGELGFDDVAALNLSRIEGAETLDIPLVGHLHDGESDDNTQQPAEWTATIEPEPYDSVEAPSFQAAWEPTYHFGMKQRRIRYDQSFFL